jgi:hypothetical protein
MSVDLLDNLDEFRGISTQFRAICVLWERHVKMNTLLKGLPQELKKHKKY